MKIKQNKTKNTILFFALVISVDLLYWLGFIGFTFKAHYLHYVIILSWTVPALLLYTISYFKSQIILTDKELIQKQLFREIHIPYDDIVYIDEEQAKHTKNIFMVHKNKYPIVITMDKDKVLFQEMKKRCHHLLPVEVLEKEGYFAMEEEWKNKKPGAK